MVDNPPAGTPRVAPYLLYEDLDAAISFLVDGFGFEERFRMTRADGRANHVELGVGDDGLVMAGGPAGDYRNPRHLGGSTQLVYVYVDDIDAHYARAKAAGAEILEEPSDQFYGDRRYACVDPEGHQWTFAQHVRDVAPEEMHQPGTD
jgi:uncharacterized glyoxalase superfamily protein PhnB